MTEPKAAPLSRALAKPKPKSKRKPTATPKDDNREREQDNHVDATDGEKPLYEAAESGSLSRHSGVGFLIAPHIVQYIVDYSMHSDRIISLKLSVKGRLLHVVCHYAPHGGYDTNAKEAHWELLNHIVEKLDKRNPKIIMGDCNARLHGRRDYEGDVIGPVTFG